MKTLCCIVFTLIIWSCVHTPANAKNNLEASGTVYIFFDPMCPDCKINDYVALKKYNVDFDIVHYLEIVGNEKSYGICYFYEAINAFDPGLALEFLKSLENVKETDIESSCKAFIEKHNILEKIQTITSSVKIENILAFDKVMSKELKINSVPSFLYKEILYTGETAYEAVQKAILSN